MNPREKALRTVATNLGVDADYEPLALLDDEYVVAYADLVDTANRRGALSKMERELILLALNAAIHIFDRDRVELHARRALAAGATPDQILSTKAEALGNHTMSTCVPVLVEELAKAGRPVIVPTSDDELTAEELDVKRQIIALRGWWHEPWQVMLRLDPAFLLAQHRFMAVGHDKLPPKFRELLYTALDVVTTHLFPNGARAHIRNALAKGATLDELMEVYELAVLVGYETIGLIVPVVHEAMAERV